MPAQDSPGFRLSKLELFNWGTFDGAVHGFHPRGETSLIVGENGSGKSTIVDALLTLLVERRTRNYNVAAGAAKNERNETSYIRGAFDRTVGAEGKPEVRVHRPGNRHYTALLACFENRQSGRVFSICQVLYIDANSQVKRVYAFDESERGIVDDLGGLNHGDAIKATLRDRGFRVTDTYKQYFEWMRRVAGFRPKAMDVFNQTVAVKDVQRLDHFIRLHMLEKQPWNEKVSQLLKHFAELSEAHRALVEVREQAEMLRPIVETGERYTQRAAELESARGQLNATQLYFEFATDRLLSPLCREWSDRIQYLDEEIARLDKLIEDRQLVAARLKVDIENAGGNRYRELPGLIERADELARMKRDRRLQFQTLLAQAEIRAEVTSTEVLAGVRSRIEQRLVDIRQSREGAREQAKRVQYQIGGLATALEEDRAELEALQRRKGNMPESMVQLRDQLCRTLRLSPRDLPFAAELMTVSPDCQPWEASIEQVLQSFARDLLVPDDLYARVSGFIDSTRLTDAAGRGQRLSYTRIERQPESASEHTPGTSLFDMLEFRENHALTPWVRGEIRRRFDYAACDSVEQFQSSRGSAMTVNRHIKKNRHHHQKDDRSIRRDFVLGWDNRAKRMALQQTIEEHSERLATLERQDQHLQDAIESATRSLGCLEQAWQTDDFDTIDDHRHEFEAEQLRIERQKLEESDDQIRELTARLADVDAERQGFAIDRNQLADERTLKRRELENGEARCRLARQRLADAERAGTLAEAARRFDDIEALLDEPLSVANLERLPIEFPQQLRQRVDRLDEQLMDVERELRRPMAKFLTKFPAFQTDLDGEVESLASFITLDEQIRKDDLPRHEQRFKKRLNEKVLHEVGVLHGSLETEREEIKGKIEQLNEALRRLQWRPQTFMRLEPSDTTDREIRDFRRELAGCLEGTLEGTPEANEATFERIEKLVGRLRDDANARWRDKVIDVRNWFNFAARELHRETGEPGSYYDGGTGQSGGEKGKLAFLVLVAAIAYQYDIDPDDPQSDRFHFVMVDEMFSRSDDAHAQYALDLFERFGLQLAIVAPLDAKARVTEPYVGMYAHVVKDSHTNTSELLSITAAQYREAVAEAG